MKFINFRYDVSGDGQIDQKELANLIAAMVNTILFIFFFYSINQFFSV